MHVLYMVVQFLQKEKPVRTPLEMKIVTMHFLLGSYLSSANRKPLINYNCGIIIIIMSITIRGYI